jgi:hypothetical protein
LLNIENLSGSAYDDILRTVEITVDEFIALLG